MRACERLCVGVCAYFRELTRHNVCGSVRACLHSFGFACVCT